MIYLDNAASTWPKPPVVSEAMMKCLNEYCANPGRGSHRFSMKSSREVFSVRRSLTRFFGGENPDNLIFTQNATESLNLALKGFLLTGDHVIATGFEHNSVRRPLEYLKKQGVEVTYVSPGKDSLIALEDLQAARQQNTKLVVVSHASNVTGSLVDLSAVGDWTSMNGIRLMVDACQTAGIYPIDIQTSKIDMLAVTGHKGLLGPQGTGFLYLSPDIDLIPLLHGGTGGNSESPDVPTMRPDRYESGTRNVVGIVGLGAGLSYVEQVGLDAIQKHEDSLTKILLSELNVRPRVTVLGPPIEIPRAPIISFIVEGIDSAEIGFILDKQFDIAVRTGLHCAPLAHEACGTVEQGAVRISHGIFTTEDEIAQFLEALDEIIGNY